MDNSDMMECSRKLHEAVLEGDYDITRQILLSQSSCVNEADKTLLNGRTALHLAAMRGRADLVTILLDNGADVSACDNQGNTPLHWCGHTETIELLVEHGASVLQCNKRGLTPRDLAERRCVPDSVYNLLFQLEMEQQEVGSCTITSHFDQAPTRSRDISPGQKSRTSDTQPLSGLWQECASELGSRNLILLILGLLALSLYVAYILTGMQYAKRVRIPTDAH